MPTRTTAARCSCGPTVSLLPLDGDARAEVPVWSSPVCAEMPGWFSWENQGVDAAVADLTGSGRPDIVVLAVDDGPGQNRGVYRIGRDLDVNGVAAGGWTAWID